MRVGFVAVLAAAFGGVAVWWVMQPVDSPPPPRMELVLGLPNDHRVYALTLSPDGRLMAYTTDAGGASQIAVRSLETTKPVLLEGTTGAHHPFFSPDGRWLGFFADGKLRKSQPKVGRLGMCAMRRLILPAAPGARTIASCSRRSTVAVS